MSAVLCQFVFCYSLHTCHTRLADPKLHIQFFQCTSTENPSGGFLKVFLRFVCICVICEFTHRLENFWSGCSLGAKAADMGGDSNTSSAIEENSSWASTYAGIDRGHTGSAGRENNKQPGSCCSRHY